MSPDAESLDRLQEENTRLRQRLMELEQAPGTERLILLQEENIQLRNRIGELEQLQGLLQSVLDNVPATIYAKDTQGRFLLVNKYWADSLQMEPADVTGKRDADLFPTEIVGYWQSLTEQVLALGKTVEREEDFPHSDGMHTYISAQFPIADAHGDIYAVGGIATDITDRKRMETRLRDSQALMQGVIDNASMLIMVKDSAGRYLLVNRLASSYLKLSHRQMIDKTDYDLMPTELADLYHMSDQEILKTGNIVKFESEFPLDNELQTLFTVKFPILNAQGDIYAIGIVSTDITERKRMERERLAMQEQVINAQRSALRELSTPLIPISDRVVIMPLIGTIDSQRAQQIMETLLEGIGRYQAEMVILDITGVQLVDSQVANSFIQTAQAVKLLGAQVMMTGIQPPIAQALVQLGIDLTGIITRSTLQAGIAAALRTYVANRCVC